MSQPHRSEEESDKGLPPGAERFWGQFSQSRAGRSAADEGEEAREEQREQRAEPERGGHECLEWCPICRSAELLRLTGSPEVRQQLQAIQSEAMQVFKAFAAAYAEKAGESGADKRRAPGHPGDDGPEEPKVTDISIE